MIVSLEWLKDYTDIKVTPEDFCEKMIMSGSNLETLEFVGNNFKNVVVGKIEKIEKHPDADKLVVCQINVGREELVQIVTGATNVFEGAYVPVALHNSIIPGPLHGKPKEEGGTKITKGKLRGVESYGMLCSFSELGFSDKVIPVDQRDGIWILNEEYELGADFSEALKLKDAIIDFEITPNRPDCLSMIGMAREAKATFNSNLKYPDVDVKKQVDKVDGYIKVQVNSPLCNRYVARVCKDVKIGPSPWWLQRRLIHAGMRPINNIVDITNFVMLEYGQPLHAFSLNSLKGGQIKVEQAVDGEKFTTLDETERILDKDMLMIKDGEKSVAIAGVMGGLNSDIEADTETIVIESANFDGNSVRHTSKKLALRTEASSRYEKGLDPNLCMDACNRVCHLIEQLGIGTVVSGEIDIYPNKYEAKEVKARVSRINHILGINLKREEMAAYLESLEMTVKGEGDSLLVTPKTVRQDIEIEEDIVEEIARLYGYDMLPVTIPKGNNEASQSKERDLKDLTRNTLIGMGLNEIQTYSFVSPKSVDNVRIDEDSWERAFVEILNPLGEDTSVMRTILTPQLLEVMGRNYSRNLPEMAAFEIGHTFMKNILNPKELPLESDNLSIGMYGDDVDFFTLKGVVVELLNVLGIRNLEFIAEDSYGVYHPGRCARVVAKHMAQLETGERLEEVEIGIMGEVHPKVSDKYGIEKRAYVCELMFENLIELSDTSKMYKPLPKYPAMSRDIALLCDEEISVGDIEKVIWSKNSPLLKDVKLFDVYRGKQVQDGKKSMAFSLKYRHEDRTLTEEEVRICHNEILKELEDKLGVTLREV